MHAIRIHKFETLVVWMRRELRLQDHLALWSATQDSREIIPLYIIEDSGIPVAPAQAKVIADALRDLSETLIKVKGNLLIRRGDPARILPAVIDEFHSSGVYCTRDYSPSVRSRDARLRSEVEKSGKVWREFKDLVLFEDREIVSAARSEPFTVFTAYKNAWKKSRESIPPVLPRMRELRTPKLVNSIAVPRPGRKSAYPEGGERAARDAFQKFLRRPIKCYHTNRDILAVDGTSRLSHHLAIGAISPRTVYHGIREKLLSGDDGTNRGSDSFLNEIIWREFYYQILSNFPHVLKGAFRGQYDNLTWSENDEHYDAWCRGETGYPVVDAAMRQLNTEGWMHNRGRMIVASFLTKDLHIDWRRGEAYFMSRLADGDPALNNGGWQWSAGTGNDAQPWFRIFNPVLQGKKFDPEGRYLRRYVPELAGADLRFVHEPWRDSSGAARQYPDRIVEHEIERKVALESYKNNFT